MITKIHNKVFFRARRTSWLELLWKPISFDSVLIYPIVFCCDKERYINAKASGSKRIYMYIRIIKKTSENWRQVEFLLSDWFRIFLIFLDSLGFKFKRTQCFLLAKQQTPKLLGTPGMFEILKSFRFMNLCSPVLIIKSSEKMCDWWSNSWASRESTETIDWLSYEKEEFL